MSAMVLAAALTAGSVLHDNGPVVNSPATGPGGADESLAQTSLAMQTLGFAHSPVSGYRVADDFEVPLCGWEVSAVLFFAYQTGASTSPSTMTGVYFEILDDVPGTPEADVVYGDLTTNRLTSSEWLQCYRADDTQSGTNTQRPIMLNRCDLPEAVTLGAGVYWLVWQTAGSLSSGPWAPPITITGQTTTGNGMQYQTGAWGSALDGGSLTQQGFPFVLEGTSTPVERTTWGAVKALFR